MAQASGAAVDRPRETPYRPWTQQLVDALPVAPLWVGVGIMLLDAASCLVWFTAIGSPKWSTSNNLFWREVFPPSLIMAALIGFSVAGVAYSRRAQLRVLERLRPALDCTPRQMEALFQEVSAFDGRRMRRVGLLLTLTIPPLIAFNPGAFPWHFGEQYVSSDPDFVLWTVWHNGLAIWLGSRAGAYEARAARLFSRIGRDHARVDVLDLSPLAPFAHRGLQSVLMYMAGLSLFALIFAGGWAVDFAPIGVMVLVPVALQALLLPLRGVHERIRETKRARLAALRAEIRLDEGDVMDRDGPGSAAAAARLPALLALRDRVEQAREWPLDLSSYLRFTLYLAIGLGSWVGGALVERLVDAVFG
jgi:hypothetical protein